MKKLIVPAILAVGGLAAVLAMGKKKPAGEAKKAAPAQKKPEMKNPKTVVYSFVSGYQDPATVEVSVKFDADKVDVAVIEGGFLVASSNPQVLTALSGDYNLQLECGSLYTGEDFAALSAMAKEKYTGFGEVEYGALKGFKYSAGDGVAFCFPVDGFSYLLVTAFKGPDNDDEVADLPANKGLAFLFENVSVAVK